MLTEGLGCLNPNSRSLLLGAEGGGGGHCLTKVQFVTLSQRDGGGGKKEEKRNEKTTEKLIACSFDLLSSRSRAEFELYQSRQPTAGQEM